jgi:hypothetical protein
MSPMATAALDFYLNRRKFPGQSSDDEDLNIRQSELLFV